MKYKKAMSPADIEKSVKEANPDADADEVSALTEMKRSELESKGLLIKQWDLDFLEADPQWCGRDGSPTKVHRIMSVVLDAKGSKDVEPSREGIETMIHELIEGHTIG